MVESTENDSRFRLIFKVEKDRIRLRDFLSNQGISRRTLTAIKYDGGKLSVNGIVHDVRHLLLLGDEVEILFPPEEMSTGLALEYGHLDIIYEDEAILILNKPPGQSTMPSSNHKSGTIANFIAGKYARELIPSTVHIVTRLDHNTSGLVCIAKNRHIHHLMSQQIMKSTFRRQYEAIVEGHVGEDEFTISEPIGRKDGSIIERIVREDGQESRTSVRVINRFTKNGRDLTKIALILHTGRTHQIRVHMQWAGHPLAGDDLYGGHRDVISRQALHCAEIVFNHPITGAGQTFRKDMPNDMKF